MKPRSAGFQCIDLIGERSNDPDVTKACMVNEVARDSLTILSRDVARRLISKPGQANVNCEICNHDQLQSAVDSMLRSCAGEDTIP